MALAAFALVPCNLLLLDEASNHLDTQTIEVLTGALQEFDGAIVSISPLSSPQLFRPSCGLGIALKTGFPALCHLPLQQACSRP